MATAYDTSDIQVLEYPENISAGLGCMWGARASMLCTTWPTSW